jgi:hypothetical protein
MLIEKRMSWLKCIENIVAKEEIAPKEQFLPLQQCFLLWQMSKPMYIREWVKNLNNIYMNIVGIAKSPILH